MTATPEGRWTLVLGAAAAIPAVVATVGILVFAANELSGAYPLSDGPPRNIAEAVGAGLDSEALRFLRAGQDPARMWILRRQVISPSIQHATAFEAAVWTRRLRMIALFDQRGLIGDPVTRRHLACLATDLSIDEIAAFLGPPPSPACEPGTSLEIVKERSRPR